MIFREEYRLSHDTVQAEHVFAVKQAPAPEKLAHMLRKCRKCGSSEGKNDAAQRIVAPVLSLATAPTGQESRSPDCRFKPQARGGSPRTPLS